MGASCNFHFTWKSWRTYRTHLLFNLSQTQLSENWEIIFRAPPNLQKVENSLMGASRRELSLSEQVVELFWTPFLKNLNVENQYKNPH